MATGPYHLDARQRALLAEFERLCQECCAAVAAAEAAERELARRVRAHELGKEAAPDAAEVQRVLALRAEAVRMQLAAMQLLRDAPI